MFIIALIQSYILTLKKRSSVLSQQWRELLILFMKEEASSILEARSKCGKGQQQLISAKKARVIASSLLKKVLV